jgi:Flp pilus assembly protein TadG
MSRVRRARPGSDAGAVVLGWFVRIAVTLALVGLIGFDCISIALARAHVHDIAADAADAAAAQYELHPSIHDALAAAMAQASTEGGTVAPDGLVLTRSGHVTTLRVTVHLVPGTALLGHLPGTGSLGETSAVAVSTVTQ